MNNILSDEIQNEINKAKKVEEEISANLKKRENKLEKKIPASSDEAKLKFQLDNYLNTINSIKLKASGNIENTRLKEQLNRFSISYDNYKKQIDKFNIPVGSVGSNENTPNFGHKKIASEDKNKSMTLQEFELKKDQQFKEGDKYLNEISGTAKIIKNGAIQIRDEIHLHDPLLNDLERNIDKVESKMKRSENKLANYLAKSTSNCLYWTILAEFIMLILFFAM